MGNIVGYLIAGLIAIFAGIYLFFILFPGLIGFVVGFIGSWGWIIIVNSNRESNISTAKHRIKLKENEARNLSEKFEQGCKEIRNMSTNNCTNLVQQARSIVSKPALNVIDKLEKEYQSITAKYYLKEFGDKKIDNDMSEAIAGKFPHTFGLSADFHNGFNKLLSQVSNTKPEIKTKEDKILFGVKLKKIKIQPTMTEEEEAALTEKLHTAIKNNNYEDVYLLINSGADVNAKNEDGSTPLHCAVDHLELIRLLIDEGADVNSESEGGFTPLLAVVLRGDDGLEVTRLLIDSGADVNAKDEIGESPLLAVATRGDDGLEVTRLLIDSGADVNAETERGVTPLLIAVVVAVAGGDGVLEVTRLLIDSGADVNPKEAKGDTPLSLAVAGGDGALEVTRLLIDRGADVTAKNKDGDTLLFRAIVDEADEVAELLIDNGAC